MRLGRVAAGGGTTISIKCFEAMFVAGSLRAVNATVASADIDHAVDLVEQGRAAYTPSIASLSPSTRSAGGAAFALTITSASGYRFHDNAKVTVNGNEYTPDSISEDGQTIVVTVPAAEIATTGAKPVVVRNYARVRNAASFAASAASNITVS